MPSQPGYTHFSSWRKSARSDHFQRPSSHSWETSKSTTTSICRYRMFLRILTATTNRSSWHSSRRIELLILSWGMNSLSDGRSTWNLTRTAV